MLLLLLSLLAQKTDPAVWSALVDARVSRTINPVVQTFSDPSNYSSMALAQYLLTIGQSGDPAAGPVIAGFLKDNELQGVALFAYGELDGASIEPLFAMQSELRSANTAAFFEALSKLGTETDGPRIFAAWDGLTRSRQDLALFHLWRVPTKALTDAVIKRFERGVGANSEGHIYYLYRSRAELDPKTTTVILNGTRSEPQTAIYATRIRTTESSPELLDAYRAYLDSSDWRLRVNALNALAGRDKESLLREGPGLLKDGNPNVVNAAARALVRLNDAEADAMVRKASNKFSDGQKVGVLAALDAQRGRQFISWLDGWDRGGAAWNTMRALQYSGRRENVDIAGLKNAVTKGYTVQAVLAMNALDEAGALDDETLKAALHSGDVYRMSSALGKLPARKDNLPVSLDTLKELAAKDYAEADFHQAYLRVLPNIAEKEHVDAEVQSLLKHTNYQVRLAAMGSLESLEAQTRASVVKGNALTKVPRPVKMLASKHFTGEGADQWVLHTTKGKITIELALQDAPITTANIIYLSGKRFFNGLPWHRVVPNFVAQGGDRRGDGSGGPGYAIPCEINRLRYERGSVGMALSGKDTGGSQFFICHSNQPHLDGGYTVFGRVIRGLKVMDQLEEGDVILKTEIK